MNLIFIAVNKPITGKKRGRPRKSETGLKQNTQPGTKPTVGQNSEMQCDTKEEKEKQAKDAVLLLVSES